MDFFRPIFKRDLLAEYQKEVENEGFADFAERTSTEHQESRSLFFRRVHIFYPCPSEAVQLGKEGEAPLKTFEG